MGTVKTIKAVVQALLPERLPATRSRWPALQLKRQGTQ